MIVVDNLLAYFAFAAGVGAHGAIGQYKTCCATLTEFAQHVEYPRIVGVAGGGHGVATPAWIVCEFVVGAPLFLVKGWVGHDVIGF